MRREPPTPTVAELWRSVKGVQVRRWVVLWSTGARGSIEFKTLDSACVAAGREYLGWIAWCSGAPDGWLEAAEEFPRYTR